MDYPKNLIPSMPSIAAHALQLVMSPNSNVREIVDVISNDPGITSTVFKLGNSVAFGSHESTSDLKIVIGRIGMSTLQQILVQAAIHESFPIESLPQSYDWRTLWEHSALTGQIAYLLAQHMRSNRVREIQIAALLHDAGVFLLGHIAPQILIQLKEECEATSAPFATLEQKHGTDLHERLGQDLVSAWNLPIPVVCAVRYHEIHSRETLPSVSDTSMNILLTVALANQLALQHGPVPVGFAVENHAHCSHFDSLNISNEVLDTAVAVGLRFLETTRT